MKQIVTLTDKFALAKILNLAWKAVSDFQTHPLRPSGTENKFACHIMRAQEAGTNDVRDERHQRVQPENTNSVYESEWFTFQQLTTRC